jgi:cell division protein FtsQ
VNAQTVRRGGSASGARKPRKAAPRVRAAASARTGTGKLAGWAFGLFVLAIAIVGVIALELPAKAGRALGSASGEAGFAVNGYQIVGLKRMDRRLVDEIVTEELHKAEQISGASGKPAQALVSGSAIRDRLMLYGWVEDARVSRRLPDQLVIDIVERQPAAVWQSKGQLSLVDANGVVLAPVPLDRMPDLPLLIGPGANGEATQLGRMLATVPTLRPQLASATWIGRRRWDLSFTSGETIALPEGERAATQSLQRFAKLDRQTGLLGRGMKRFDLRVPDKMIVRLPAPPPAPQAPEVAS